MAKQMGTIKMKLRWRSRKKRKIIWMPTHRWTKLWIKELKLSTCQERKRANSKASSKRTIVIMFVQLFNFRQAWLRTNSKQDIQEGMWLELERHPHRTWCQGVWQWIGSSLYSGELITKLDTTSMGTAAEACRRMDRVWLLFLANHLCFQIQLNSSIFPIQMNSLFKAMHSLLLIIARLNSSSNMP